VSIDTLAEQLRPAIEHHRDEADRLGRLPDQLVAELLMRYGEMSIIDGQPELRPVPSSVAS
jgi:hypothetical protein